VLPAVTDASYGVGLLAGVAAGFFESAAAAARLAQGVRAAHDPDPARAARYDALFALYKDTQAVLAPINHRLHAFAQQR